MKKLLALLGVLILILIVGEKKNLLPQVQVEKYIPQITPPDILSNDQKLIDSQEQLITDVVERSIPSVVTIGISKTTRENDSLSINPFNPFQPFRRVPGRERQIEQNIGSGFIISEDGLILTNRHVVEDQDATYTVFTSDEQSYKVENIYRDRSNDIAILKITASNLKSIPMGDSSKLKLGQIAIAIGTPLGEFTNTVTTGVISGLGRGITAGSPYEGYVEELKDVIQTDAAISPGNSGGPLLNSRGEVIGINTAIASEGQNIGFAIPVNIAKDRIARFNERGGNFETPYIGVRYSMIDRQTALLNSVVEGAYVIEIFPDSPAERAGIQEEDIITEIDGIKLREDADTAFNEIIAEKKVGDTVTVTIWRPEYSNDQNIEGETLKLRITLEASR